MNYTKNAFGYTQILTQLKERGLLFKDEEQAIKEFPDTYFEDAVYIYYFDKKWTTPKKLDKKLLGCSS